MVGFGGAVLRAQDPAALTAWYARVLEVPDAGGWFEFPAAGQRGPAVLAFVGPDADALPADQAAMVNLQVDDLDAVLARAAAAGAAIDPERTTADYGRFGWFVDPEGNRVELWEPAED